MLQVRAAHCPNCKEATPPGADHCPICGEDLTWKTTDGKKVSTQTVSASKSSSLMNVFWIAIAFVGACLISMIFVMLRTRSDVNSGRIKPPTQRVIASPTATPLPQNPDETAESRAENAVSDNAVTDNSVSNSATPSDGSDLTNLGVE